VTAILSGAAAPTPKHATLVSALHEAARSEAALTFVDLHEREERLPFSAIRDRAEASARALIAHGVRPGDRVAIVAPTGPSFMDAFFGALLAGAVAVPLYPPVRLGRLDEYHASTARMLAAAEVAVVLADARVRRLLGVPVARARPPLGCVAIEELAGCSAPVALPAVAGEALAIIQYSSGSTVDPKPVALSHANVLAQCAALEALLLGNARPGAPLRRAGVSWLPLYHDMGLIGALLSAVCVPADLVLVPPEHFLARPALWLRAIARHRATVSPAPNFAYAYAAKRVTDAQLAGVDLSCWQFALNGAEPVSPAAIDRFVERFAPYGFDARAMRPVYGLAEAALAVTFPTGPVRARPHGDAQRAIVSVGAPIPGASIRICDDAGAIVATGVVGRVQVRGPSLMRGYFARPAETARAIADGWLDTGDLGFVEEGELYVCGRAKDVIVIRGANHAPQTFEEPLDQVRGVRPGCAVAVGWTPPEGDGEVLVLLVERLAEGADERPGEPALEARIRAAVADHSGIRPEIVRVLAPGTLPRTSSGKLRRGEALRRFAAGELDAPTEPTPLRMAAALVRSTLAFAGARLEARLRAPAPIRDA
jgi:acyl-CoA synthetase (AMP-forming)/AMP-acid ligase II